MDKNASDIQIGQISPKAPKKTYLDFNGVRIYPKKLVLRNAYEGKKFVSNITFQNISSKIVILKTMPPVSTPFVLSNPLISYKLMTGLTVSVQIKYTCCNIYNRSSLQTFMKIHVNSESFHYRIYVREAVGEIVANPRLVNFGMVNKEQTVCEGVIQLTNKGYKTSKFEIDLGTSESLCLNVDPKKGFIPALGFINIRIEFIGFEEGFFMKDLWVKCDKPFRISIFANVITPKLYLTDDLKSINDFYFLKFPAIYCGCNTEKTCTLLNFDTINSSYAVVPEIDDEILSFEAVKRKNGVYNWFTVCPITGILAPGEEKSITFRFQPKSENLHMRKNFFTQFRIIRLPGNKICEEYDDAITENPRTFGSSATISSKDVSEIPSDISYKVFENNSALSTSGVVYGSKCIRLCLHTIIEPLKVFVNPDHINLGSIEMNVPKYFEIEIFNKNDNLPIFYAFNKIAFLQTSPSKGIIRQNSREIIELTFLPRSAIQGSTYIHLLILFYNKPCLSSHVSKLQIIDEIKIPIHVKVRIKKVALKPKVNLGITPELTNEVGFLTEKIKFKKGEVEKPIQAMLDLDFKESDAVIAFPNDMATCLRPSRKDLIIKTIFARLPRHIIPADDYMLTPREKERKMETWKYYTKYIQDMWKSRYSVEVAKSEIMIPQRENACMFEECRNLKFRSFYGKFPPPCHKCVEKDCLASHCLETDFKDSIKVFFVTPFPSFLDVGKVAANSRVEQNLSFNNGNEAPVFVKMFIPQSSRQCLKCIPNRFEIDSQSSRTITVQFIANITGRYQTIISATINKIHSIPIIFRGIIVNDSLVLSTNDLVINLDDCNLSNQFTLTNQLNIPVDYTWQIPADNCFQVKPKYGTVDSKKSILSEVYYRFDHSNRHSSKLKIYYYLGGKETVAATIFVGNFDVIMKEKTINVPNIPLNLKYSSKAVIINRSNEPVKYIIRNFQPLQGIMISPSEGVIKRKSYQQLKIDFYIRAVISFDVFVDIEIYQGRLVTFRIVGNVVYPSLIITPNVITLKRIVCGAFTSFPFTLKNDSSAEMTIEFIKKVIPDFYIFHVDEKNTKNYLVQFNLHPGEEMHLKLCFYATDVSWNRIYLPLKINDLFFPPFRYVDGEEPGIMSKEFLKVDEELYRNEFCTPGRYPEIIPLILVDCISARAILKFSTYRINFKYLDHPKYKSTTLWNLKITNKYKKDVKFLMRIEELEPHFRIKEENLKYIDKTDLAIEFSLEKDESLVIPIEFVPEDRGNFYSTCPIFVRDYNDNSMFNYLEVTGICPRVKLSCPIEIILPPMAIGSFAKYTLYFTAFFHTKNCSFKIEYDIPEVSINYTHGNDIPCKELQTELQAELFFHAKKIESYHSYIVVSCACGGRASIKFIAAVDNSFVTTHISSFCRQQSIKPFLERSSVMVHENSSLLLTPRRGLSNYKFPYFVLQHDKTPYAKYMNKICEAVETWVFKQAMYGKYYVTIPEQICDTYIKLSSNDEGSENRRSLYGSSDSSEMLTIHVILISLLGEQVKSALYIGKIPKKSSDRITHIHTAYVHLLKFLKNQGAYLPHVKAKFLLRYDDYHLFETKLRQNPVNPSDISSPLLFEESFFLRSKQAWIDVLLQTYKVFVLPKIGKPIDQDFLDICPPSLSVLSMDLSPDHKLKKWLSDCFNRNKENLLKISFEKPEDHFIPTRNIDNFDSDFADGLVLICLMLEYCPYVENMLRHIYLVTDTYEYKFHNCAKLNKIVKILKLSFDIVPGDIVRPCSIKIYMFACYCYETLPNLFPKDTIRFKASLSKKCVETVTLKNPTNIKAYYTIILLCNDLNFFEVNAPETIQINSQSSETIKITFTAKKAHDVRTILIFCGETVGEPYSKSHVFVLHGEVNFEEEFQKFQFKMPIYKMQENDLNIISPYKEEREYSIKIFYQKPKANDFESATNELIPFIGGIYLKLATSNQSVFKTNSKGFGKFNLNLATFFLTCQKIWVVFYNKDVGDFFINVILESDTSKTSRQVIEIPLPNNWDRLKCTCRNTRGEVVAENLSTCPRLLTIRIPKRNELLYKLIKKVFLAGVETEIEKEAWEFYLDSEAGPDILCWLLEEEYKKSHNYTKHHQKAIIYNVKGKTDYTLPANIIIENIKDFGFVSFTLHFNEDQNPKNFFMTLTSQCNKEIRYFKVKFVAESENVQNMRPKISPKSTRSKKSQRHLKNTTVKRKKSSTRKTCKKCVKNIVPGLC